MAAIVLKPNVGAGAMASAVAPVLCSPSTTTTTTTAASSVTTNNRNIVAATVNRVNKEVVLAAVQKTLVLNTRLNGVAKLTQVEVCAQGEETSVLGEETFQDVNTVQHVQNHLEEDEGSSNDSFDPLTMLGLKPPKKKVVVDESPLQLPPKTALSNVEVTDDDPRKRLAGPDKLYKTSPLLNGLLDKVRVLLPGEDGSVLTNGEATEAGNEVETVQYISAIPPEGMAGGATLLIARALDQQQLQSQHIQIVQNSNGGAPGTTPIAILNMADLANQSTSDLSSLSDITRTLECASKAISRTNAECNSQLPILAVPSSTTGGTTHIVSVLRLNPQATLTLPMNSGQQQFLQTHIVRLPTPTVTLKMEDASELIGLPQISSGQLRHLQFQTAPNTTLTASGEVVQASLKRPSSASAPTTTCIILEAKRPRTEIRGPKVEKGTAEENRGVQSIASVAKAGFQEQRLLLPKPKTEENKIAPLQSTLFLTNKNVVSGVGAPPSGSQLASSAPSVVATAVSVALGVASSNGHTIKQQTSTASVVSASTRHQQPIMTTVPVITAQVAAPTKRPAAGNTVSVPTGSGHLAGKVVGAAKDTLAHGEIKGTAAGRLHFTCDWRNCHRKFVSPSAVFLHVQKTHMPALVRQEALCEWNNCDKMKRKKLSLLTHIQDRHCNEQLMQMQALRKQQIAQFGKSSIPPPQPPPLHPGYAPDAALLAIRRHALQYLTPREAVEEKEGPLTKSIRLTAALLLRNLALFCPSACSQLRQHEPELVGLAMSTVESSRTIAQCLLELARPAGQHN